MAQFNNAYFITVDYIKKYYSGYLDQNIDADALNSFIIIAQNVRTQSVLGYDLLNRYISDINTYGEPNGAQYIFLMNNFIQQALALWTIYEALPSLQTKVTNIGVVNKNSDNSTIAADINFKRIHNQVNNNAQYYDQRIREYLTNYPQDFPEYFINTGVNRIRAKNNNYFAGLWLPDVVRPPKRNAGWQDGNTPCNGCNTGNGYYLN